MKQAGSFFLAALAAALLLQAGTPAGAATAEEPDTEASEEMTEQLSDEDREIIENMEMLKNLELYDNENMEMLLTLDVLTANE